VRNAGDRLSPGSFSVYREDLSGSVSFGGEPAQMLFVSRRQVNGRVPDGLNPGRVTVEVLVGRAGEPRPPPGDILEKAAPVVWIGRCSTPMGCGPSRKRIRPGRENGSDICDRVDLHCSDLPTYLPSQVQTALSVTALPDRPGVSEVAMEVSRSWMKPHVLLFWGGRNSARSQCDGDPRTTPGADADLPHRCHGRLRTK
jgi:hypothetical protein